MSYTQNVNKVLEYVENERHYKYMDLAKNHLIVLADEVLKLREELNFYRNSDRLVEKWSNPELGKLSVSEIKQFRVKVRVAQMLELISIKNSNDDAYKPIAYAICRRSIPEIDRWDNSDQSKIEIFELIKKHSRVIFKNHNIVYLKETQERLDRVIPEIVDEINSILRKNAKENEVDSDEIWERF